MSLSNDGYSGFRSDLLAAVEHRLGLVRDAIDRARLRLCIAHSCDAVRRIRPMGRRREDRVPIPDAGHVPGLGSISQLLILIADQERSTA